MTIRFKPLLPFLLGACVVLTWAALILKVRYELQMERETAHVRMLLEEVRDKLSAELNRAADSLGAAAPPAESRAKRPDEHVASPWSLWRLDAAAGEYIGTGGGAPQISEQILRRALDGRRVADGSMLLLGPFATDAGANAVAIAGTVRAADGSTHWRGATALIDAIVPAAAAAELMRQGYRLQWLDLANHTALYQSDLGNFEAPVTAGFRFSACRLQ